MNPAGRTGPRRAGLPRTAWLLLGAGLLVALVAAALSLTVLSRGASTRDRLELEISRLQRQLAENGRRRASLEAAAAAERKKLAETAEKDAAASREETAEIQREASRLQAELDAARRSGAENEARIAELEGQLSLERGRVTNLDRERTAGERILARYQGGVGLVQGIWSLADPSGPPAAAIEHQVFSGTGFLVSTDGLILTNRHVVQPWWGEGSIERRIAHGAAPRIESLRIYFPGIREPFDLRVVAVSERADVAVVKAFLGDRRLPILQIDTRAAAAVPGQPVLLIGYPAGLDALVARLDDRSAEAVLATSGSGPVTLTAELARRGLIRPLATRGFLSDALPDQLVYDAPTTFGASGGPVLNLRGKVIGINSAILPEFSGASFGVPIRLGAVLLPRVVPSP